jgi:hypothetical protein
VSSLQPSDQWPAISHLDAALNPATEADEETPDATLGIAAGGAWVVLRILLRWFLGL